MGMQSSLAQSEEDYVSLLRDEGALGAGLSCSGALSNVRRSLQSQVREILPTLACSAHSSHPIISICQWGNTLVLSQIYVARQTDGLGG